MKRLLFLFIFLNLIFNPAAQGAVKIQNDPSIVTGKTSNGLTFYLIKNSSAGKGHADFYMVQNWGTSVESQDEKGFTSLLSGMNLMESRGYPDGTLFSSLCSLGIPLDNSLVFKTDLNHVILGLRDVPLSSPTTADEALSALVNMCSGAELNDETLHSGRSFHYNNTARDYTIAARERTDLFKSLFPDNLHLVNDPDEEIDNLFSTDAIKIWNFQKNWFKPAAQALIIIGDFDVNTMQSKLSLIAHTLPKGDKVTIPSNTIDIKKGAEVFHAYVDREADKGIITVDFIQQSLKLSERNTPIQMVQQYISDLLCHIIDARIGNIAGSVSFPIFAHEVRKGSFYGINDTDNLSIRLYTSPDLIQDATKFLAALISDLNNGITSTEFRNATEWSMKQMSSTPDLKAGAIRHFLAGYPVPSTKDRTDYATKLQGTFSEEDMNAYLSSYLDDDTYRIIHCVSPFEMTDTDLQICYHQGKDDADSRKSEASILPYTSDISKSSAKLKAPVVEPITGSQTYNLPNLAKIYFKKNETEPGWISISAVSKGGLSIADKSIVYLSRYINGLSGLTIPPIPDSKDIQLYREFTPDKVYLKGRCRTEDIETMFRLISACFSDCRIEKKAFIKKFNELALEDVYGYCSPEYRMDRLLSNYLEPKKDFSTPDWQTVTNFINQTCSNIGSYTFLISGDCPENTIKENIERYLVPLQGRRSTSVPRSGIFMLEPQMLDITESMTMERSRHMLGLRITGEVPYSLTGITTANVISTLIRQKIAESMFSEGILAESSKDVIRYPRNLLSIEFKLSSPDDLSDYVRLMNATLDEMETNGVTKDRIEAAKKSVIATLTRSEASENDFWINMMEARLNGKDFISNRTANMSAISADEINTTLKTFITSASRKIIRIIPEEIEVPGLPPIEFEEPFLEPLDMSLDIEALIRLSVADTTAITATEPAADADTISTVNNTITEDNAEDSIEDELDEYFNSQELETETTIEVQEAKDTTLNRAMKREENATVKKSDTSDK